MEVGTSSLNDFTPSILRRRLRMSPQHPPENIISVQTKVLKLDHLLKIYVHFPIQEPEWIIAMQNELNEFKRNKVWDLVERPPDHTIIGTRWVFRNKLNEDVDIIRL